MSRYVDINKVLDELYLSHNDIVYIDKKACAERIKKIPSIDIVRCQECKHYDNEDYGEPTRYCTWHESVVNSDDFCSYGERREP